MACGDLTIDLMPYHEVGASKYDDLCLPRPDLAARVPERAELDAWTKRLVELGVLNLTA